MLDLNQIGMIFRGLCKRWSSRQVGIEIAVRRYNGSKFSAWKFSYGLETFNWKFGPVKWCLLTMDMRTVGAHIELMSPEWLLKFIFQTLFVIRIATSHRG